MAKKISLFSLVVLIIASIDNIRNLPSAALFGSSLIFFFVLAALIFLIPTSLVAAELSSAFPDKGGVYQWVNRAFGQKLAMAAIWLQWINTMVWFPTILSFIAGTLAYLINPALAQNKIYLIICILTIFWTLTLINLKGIHISAMLNNICCLIGTIIPLLFLIILGIVWLVNGHPLQIHIGADNILPNFGKATNWVSLIAIMASFLGVELSGVHVNDIHNPQRNFPRAVLFACIFIFLSMAFGSLAIAFVLPAKDIQLISGVMQVFSSFFHVFGLESLIPVLTLLIVVGSTGMMINWLIAPAKGLLHAAEFGFLPPVFSRKNKAGVAYNILLAQAVVVSLFCFIFLFEESINGFYWFLTALSTELYMIMYILMFASGLRLHYVHTNREPSFKIPGKSLGIWLVSFCGLIGCLLTIVVSFIPPDNVDIGNPWRYIYRIGTANVITIAPLLLFYWHQKKRRLT